MSEKIKFIVLIKKGSETERLFDDDYDAFLSGNYALHCSDMDLSGGFARVVRISDETSPAWKKGILRQTFWLPAADIAAAFEYDESNPGIGFGGGSTG